MHLLPEQIRIINACLSSPGLLTAWEREYIRKLDRDRRRYRMRNTFLTDRQAGILERIGRKPEIQNAVARAAQKSKQGLMRGPGLDTATDRGRPEADPGEARPRRAAGRR